MPIYSMPPGKLVLQRLHGALFFVRIRLGVPSVLPINDGTGPLGLLVNRRRTWTVPEWILVVDFAGSYVPLPGSTSAPIVTPAGWYISTADQRVPSKTEGVNLQRRFTCQLSCVGQFGRSDTTARVFLGPRVEQSRCPHMLHLVG